MYPIQSVSFGIHNHHTHIAWVILAQETFTFYPKITLLVGGGAFHVVLTGVSQNDQDVEFRVTTRSAKVSQSQPAEDEKPFLYKKSAFVWSVLEG